MILLLLAFLGFKKIVESSCDGGNDYAYYSFAYLYATSSITTLYICFHLSPSKFNNQHNVSYQAAEVKKLI